jgi:TatD DNase family protein
MDAPSLQELHEAGARWIDSHAHLTMLEPDEVVPALGRAAAVGVGGVLVPATNRQDLDRARGLAEDHPGVVVAAAGVHPHDAASLDAGLKRELERSLQRPGVVAVGEIGLDYYYMSSPREDQLQALRWQLDLALEAGRPVILHNRESWSDLAEALQPLAGRLTGVCHSFAEGPDQARQVRAWGLLVGISGMVTFKAADNIREMAAVLGPGDVLVETDSPFLAPVPHRGRTNEPAYVVLSATRLAGIMDVAPVELARATTTSFLELLGLPEGWGSVAV